MEKFGRGQPVSRVEDSRFLTGAGRYIDDMAPADALFAYVLRSTVGHGRINGIDTSAAAESPGVHLIVTASDLTEAGLTGGIGATKVRQPDGTRGADPKRPMLAEGKVRHVGEAIALVVADSLIAAKDAAELIELDIDELPAHVALATGGEELHDEAPQNRAFTYGLGDKDAVEAAIAGAARVVRFDVPDHRIIVNSMEPRGVWAEAADGRIHVCVNGQGVWGPKGDLAKWFGRDPEQFRVTTPDVGGGFGMKGSPYPEMFLVAFAAEKVGRPVRWMSDRTEAMLTDNGGRDLTSTSTLAFDENNRIVAYKVESVSNIGAYNSNYAQMIQTELFSKVMPGTYDIPLARLEVTGVYTNTAPVDAYRGAGRPEAIYVLERSMDNAARELGVDPWELRRTNFIRPDQFPYTSATGTTYDVGEFSRLLDRAREEADLAGLDQRRSASEARGRLRGVGLSYYIESILGDPSETSTVVFGEDGVEIRVGTQSNGQGHETVYARFLADHTGIPMERIRVVQGDSDLIPTGGGTGGSRSVTVQNNATLVTVDKMVREFSAFLAEEEGVDAGEITFDDERFRIPGSNLTPTMLDVADMARARGREELLTQTAVGKLEARSFPNGAHVAEVEIDPETGVVTVERYTVVDDFGNLINPMLAEGQVHGGVAQGLGQVLMEHGVYDETGQLLTATFMDYAMPRSDDMPWVAFHSVPVPSVYNVMGMKGCGEAGTVGAMAAVANAVADAVAARGLAGKVAMPLTPLRVWSLLNEAAA
ncbi:xanthine dehydrogenase family protein molybdopterin-binding subunit [Wenxinia marina]|uniref:Wenxma_13, whole genome shotgun sequence n=1 Tax=Wenxinia marina DSM 24838 TaxID=1123501 RepID=A0A0D0Q7L1_9RHOB|nr:xanthine dehydrogenase family protein molybdopterin-binding subunit [Wenxinia marina]KIQ68452.1 Aerobic-type carbon monoxide dehydrogenase, large subunit CoxL/CutL-like protein [Wenxinia marina DSM 24838]GGL72128.1 carbon monoxide dehydrogenase [Wenxinia marina]